MLKRKQALKRVRPAITTISLHSLCLLYITALYRMSRDEKEKNLVKILSFGYYVFAG
jgi:hypothetical protein